MTEEPCPRCGSTDVEWSPVPAEPTPGWSSWLKCNACGRTTAVDNTTGTWIL